VSCLKSGKLLLISTSVLIAGHRVTMRHNYVFHQPGMVP